MSIWGTNPNTNFSINSSINIEDETKKKNKWQPLIELGVFLTNPIGGAFLTADKAVELFNDGEGLTEIADEAIIDASEIVEEKVSDIKDEFIELRDKLIELKEKYPVDELTKRTFKESENFGDFLAMQNYIATNVMQDGFSVDELEKYINTWEYLRDAGREEGVKVIDSNISEEDKNLAMDEAINLLESRINENREAMPEYGDCKSYYNEGSLADWLLTHPLSFGIQALDENAKKNQVEFLNTIFDENGELNKENFENWRNEIGLSEQEGQEFLSALQEKINTNNNIKHVIKDICGKDGMFTFQNIPNYIEKAVHPTINGVRASHWTEMLQINSTKTIEEQLNEQEQLLEELKNSKNYPEKFAQIYYQITNGINFDAEKVLEFKEQANSENGAKYTEEVVIGRNFISEDLKKNRMGTDILFEVNKSVGTALCKKIPAGGFLTAELINLFVSYLDNNTQGNKEEKKDNFEIFVQETLRSFIGTYGENISGKLVETAGVKPDTKSGKWFTKLTKKSIQSKTQDAIVLGMAPLTSDTIGEAAKKSIMPAIDGTLGFN